MALFESQNENMKRIVAYLKYTGAHAYNYFKIVISTGYVNITLIQTSLIVILII